MGQNVYSYIDSYYLIEPDLDTLLPKDLLTDFLQRQAWKGKDDKALRLIWRHIYAYILANLNTDQTSFQNHSTTDVKNILAWLRDYALDFDMSAKNIKEFLNIIQLSHEYLLDVKYINNIYVDFRSLYNECIDSNGNIKIVSSPKDGDNVLHIDFSDRTVKPQEFVSSNLVAYRQPIYIREHLMDFTEYVFDTISKYNYTQGSEKLFDYYTLYWDKYTALKLFDVEYDAELLESFALNEPTNIIGFAEYLVFGANFEADGKQIINKVLNMYKHNFSFIRFLEYYRNSRIKFFKIVSTLDEPTQIEDILTNELITMEDIYITQCGVNEVFVAYFNPQNKLLPTATISINFDEMQILAFQDILKKMSHYFLGEQASINDFLAKHDLLARYLFVSSALNKRIGILFRQAVQAQKPVPDLYNSMRSANTDFIEKNIKMVTGSLSFSEQEKYYFNLLWQDLYVSIDDQFDFSSSFGLYIIGSIKAFTELNFPERMGVNPDSMGGFDSNTLEEYENKVKRLLNWKCNHLRYRTELGMINFIDSLIDKE